MFIRVKIGFSVTNHRHRAVEHILQGEFTLVGVVLRAGEDEAVTSAHRCRADRGQKQSMAV